MNTLIGEVLTLPKMSGSVSAPSQLSGNVGAKTINIGGKGDDGATFIPSVSADGIISWTNDKDLTNPEPVNIKGEKGDKGDPGEPGADGKDGKDGQDGYTPQKGVDYFDGQPGKDGSDGKDGADGYTPVKGKDYFDGKDGQDGSPGKDGSNGVSATHSWNGTVLTVTSASGTSSADLKGEKGNQGNPGKTAYAYAQDGGYTGTEEEFAEKLAQELPTKVSELENDSGYASRSELPRAFYVTFSDDSVDKTNAEIYEAYQAGKSIYLALNNNDNDGIMIPCSYCDEHLAAFFGLYENTLFMVFDEDNAVDYVELQLALRGEIPTALPNPNALTINGVSYDGSETKDFTDAINTMIDSKLASITNAEEVPF